MKKSCWVAFSIEPKKEAVTNGQTVRADDTESALRIRLNEYRRQTAPLADYYRAKGILKSIDGL
jgi:adenylate kinase